MKAQQVSNIYLVIFYLPRGIPFVQAHSEVREGGQVTQYEVLCRQVWKQFTFSHHHQNFISYSHNKHDVYEINLLGCKKYIWNSYSYIEESHM